MDFRASKLRDEFNMDTHVLMQRYELKDSTVNKLPKKSAAVARLGATRKEKQGGKSRARARKSKSVKAITRKTRNT